MASSLTDCSDRFLLTVHGVVSDNSGLAQLRSKCEEALPGLIADSFYYESLLPYRDITPKVASLIFRTVRDKLALTWLAHIRDHGRRLFVVAHSFGTLAVIRALEMHIPGLQIEGLVLLGSIVPRNYYWDGLIGSGQLRYPPLAVIRPFDRVVSKAHLVDGDNSGARGFIANGTFRPREVFKSGGHTAYHPHDCDDVIRVIRDGILSVQVRSRTDWEAALRRPARLLLKFAALI